MVTPGMLTDAPRRSVDILLFDGAGRILLQFRDARATIAPLSWSFRGGQVDEGEADVREAAVREAREELGVELDVEAFEQCGLRIDMTAKWPS